jgi:uncharacterized protein (DUF427 family)
MVVRVADESVAESDDAIRVDEDDSTVRYYFPREDVRMDKLQPSATITQCPFKGSARYSWLPDTFCR